MPTSTATAPLGPHKVAGIDGWRKGWVVAVSTPAEPLSLIEVQTIDQALSITDGFHAVGIDMPLSLPITERRAAEEALKSYLGKAARSIFYSPVRAAIDCADRASADAVNRAAGGGGISAQSWGLAGSIRQARSALRDHEQHAQWWETHPESSFVAMHSDPGLARQALQSKKTAVGAAQRLALLAPVFGDVLHTISQSSLRAPLDDVLDSLAANWSARRIATGAATVFGPVDRDDEGFPLGIRI